MVYAMRSNRTIVSAKPLKTKRVQSERSKEIDAFMKTHKLSVQTDASGKVRVTASKKSDE